MCMIQLPSIYVTNLVDIYGVEHVPHGGEQIDVVNKDN